MLSLQTKTLANVTRPAPDAETQLREMAGDRPLPPVGQRQDDPVAFSPPPPDAETQLRDMAGNRSLIAATQKQDLPEPDTSNVVALSVPQQQITDNTFTPEPPEISQSTCRSKRVLAELSNITESKFDLNNPMQMELINVARNAALLRLAKDEPLFLPKKMWLKNKDFFICLMLCNQRLRQKFLGWSFLEKAINQGMHTSYTTNTLIVKEEPRYEVFCGPLLVEQPLNLQMN